MDHLEEEPEQKENNEPCNHCDEIKTNISSNFQKPYEATGIKKDGTRFPIKCSGKCVRFRDHDVRQTAVRDLTEVKMVQTERLKKE